MSDIKNSLKEFYNKNAKKYHETRKKHRQEIDIIIEEISLETNKKISILEFGCGGGRFMNNFSKKISKKVNYIGVDISSNLIKIAKKENSDYNFVCSDITQYIKTINQESFDYIIGTESFQHIPTAKERFFLMKNFYRILKYDGKLIITNRCLSNWFIKKYYKNILHSIMKYIISSGKNSRRDLFIPRKNKSQNKETRFYHILGLKELENFAKLSGFVIKKLGYIQKDNTISKKRQNARTSILIANKNIFKSSK